MLKTVLNEHLIPLLGTTTLLALLFAQSSCSDNEPSPVVVKSVSPDQGYPLSEIKIKGSGFGSDPSKVVITFEKNQVASISFLSDSVIITNVPAAAEPGPILISVDEDRSFEWNYFEVLNGKWRRIADVPGLGRSLMSTFSANGKGYIMGGHDNFSESARVFEYDPVKDLWREKAQAPIFIESGAYSFSLNGKLYVVGGDSFEGQSFLEYDPLTDQWEVKTPFPGAGSDGVSFQYNGKGYAGAGNSFDGEDRFYEYDPIDDTWTMLNEVPFSLTHSRGFTIGDYHYAIIPIDHIKQVVRYDLVNDTWTQLNDVPFNPTFFESAFAIGQRGYYASMKEVWEYNPATDSWTQKTSAKEDQHLLFVSSFVIGDKAYIGSGWFDGFFFDKYQEFDPQQH